MQNRLAATNFLGFLKMFQTHKVFLIWLLYATITVFGAAAFIYSGIPKLAIFYDHSHLTVALAVLYVLAEILSGRQAWKISNEQRIAMSTLAITKIENIIPQPDDDQAQAPLRDAEA